MPGIALLPCAEGNSLPIIGIGLLSSATSLLTADVTFALVIAACAVSALIIGAKQPPSSPH